MVKTRSWDKNNTRQYNHYDISDDVELLHAWSASKGRCELRSLWRAVIAQSLSDALNRSKKLSNRMERARAIAWFSLHNKDFLTVCSYAELDPEYVLDKVRNALANRHP